MPHHSSNVLYIHGEQVETQIRIGGYEDQPPLVSLYLGDSMLAPRLDFSDIEQGEALIAALQAATIALRLALADHAALKAAADRNAA